MKVWGRYLAVSGLLLATTLPISAWLARWYGTAVARRFGIAMAGTLIAQQSLVGVALKGLGRSRESRQVHHLSISHFPAGTLLETPGFASTNHPGYCRLEWCRCCSSHRRPGSLRGAGDLDGGAAGVPGSGALAGHGTTFPAATWEMSMWPQRERDLAPVRVEIAGWIGFLVYVGLVYLIRRTLNGPRRAS